MTLSFLSTENSALSNFINLNVWQFVSHPLTYRLVNQRWNYGLPSQYLEGWKLVFLYIFTILETTLTPFLSPLITYVFYMDQKSGTKTTRRGKAVKTLPGLYVLYTVITVKESNSRV